MPRSLFSALLLAACSGGGQVDVPLRCEGLVVEPDVLDWTDARFDEVVAKTVEISLPCPDEADVRVVDAWVDGDPLFAIPSVPDSVPAGGSATVRVRYEPDDYGPHAAQLVIDTASGELRVSMVGRPDPDQDGDGVLAIGAGGDDCDDLDPAVGAPTDETTNLIDDDCDGFVDEHALEAGDVLIAELMLRPQEARLELGQWLEVRNTTERDIDLLNWRIEGNAGALTVSASTVVAAGEAAVLGVSDDTAVNGGIEVDGLLVGPGSPMAQRDWSMTLVADKMVIAELERLAWPDPRGASISLDPIVDDAFRATLIDYWCESESELPNGDSGTPGTDNDRCDTVDHDGDGRTVLQGDCDDDNDTVAPGKREAWDGLDNDCNGVVDMMWADDIDVGHLDGTSTARLGGEGDVGLGDLDGDGTPEIYTGETNTGTYTVYGVPSSVLRGGSGRVVDTTYYAWRGSSESAIVGAARELGDIDGDGDDDLMLLTRSVYTSDDLAWIVDALPSTTGTETERDEVAAVLTNGRPGTYGFGMNGAILTLDLDGDGAQDPVVADTAWLPEEVTSRQHGRVYVLDLDGAAGEIAAPDQAEAAWDGAPWAALGMRPSGGDVDDDGYDDLFLRDTDPSVQMASLSVHIVLGGSTLPSDGSIASAAGITIANLAPRVYTSAGPVHGTLLHDVDDDGDQDLVVSDPYDARVVVFRDAATLTGTLDITADFDLEIEGAELMGQDLSTADFNDDGRAELIVGAPSSNRRGLVYVFGPDMLSAEGSAESGEADVILWGETTRDRFGTAVFGADLGGGPRDDLLVSAPVDAALAGRLWLFEPQD